MSKLDAFLKFNECKVLTYSGTVTKETIKKLAEDCYEEFDNTRRQVEVQQADEADTKEIGQIMKSLRDKKE